MSKNHFHGVVSFPNFHPWMYGKKRGFCIGSGSCQRPANSGNSVDVIDFVRANNRGKVGRKVLVFQQENFESWSRFIISFRETTGVTSPGEENFVFNHANKTVFYWRTRPEIEFLFPWTTDSTTATLHSDRTIDFSHGSTILVTERCSQILILNIQPVRMLML